MGIGLGFSYNYLLQVRGRKSGKLYSTPINRLEWNGKRYLVAPRGHTQWVRNAEAAGEVLLKKGSKQQQFRLRALGETEKLEILKAYLDTFKREVQGYFPIPAGSPIEAFAAIAANYPAFELLPVGFAPPRRFHNNTRKNGGSGCCLSSILRDSTLAGTRSRGKVGKGHFESPSLSTSPVLFKLTVSEGSGVLFCVF